MKFPTMFATMVGGAAALSAIIAPQAASAAPDVSTTVNLATQLCLDGSGNGQVHTAHCDGGSHQRWNVFYGNYGWRFQNMGTWRCLDSKHQDYTVTTPCDQASTQEWQVTEDQFGKKVKNLATGKCLDSNAYGEVYTIDCNDGKNQRWTF